MGEILEMRIIAPKVKEKPKHSTIRFPAQLVADLDSVAKQLGYSRSALIRELLEIGLEEQKKHLTRKRNSRE